MNFNLKRFQRKYSNDLTFGIKNLLEDQNIKNKVCIFQSPTGSGKTLMLANTIYNLIKDIENLDICFLWMTIGKGDLHIKSKKNLEKYFSGFPKVKLLEDEFGGVENDLGKNNVVVTN